jgi:lipoprotein-anchoring transpeptidase ErfK/SrfK
VVRRSALLSVLLGALVLTSACTSKSTATSTVTVSSQVTAPGAGSSSSGAAPSAAGSPTAVSVPAITTPAASSTAVTASTSASSSIPTTTTSTSKVVVLPPVAKVAAAPAFGTTDLAPAQPIVVSVTKGRIKDFTLTNPDGRAVKGAVSADGTRWTAGEVLGYGKTYTAKGSAVGTDGKTVAIRGTYATVQPDTRVRVNVSPGDGDTVGVAAPVIVRFGMEPADRAAVEKRMVITTTPKVEGAWAWIKHDDGLWALDWRPKAYWPAGTKVHVAANVYGVKFGDGAYGSDDVTTDFKIGRSQVVYADAKSHHIVVKRNGKTVADYPASYGSGDDIGDKNRVTRSGIHVVNELLPVHKMSNPAYGYVNVTEYWDVRISDNGEFIHQNQGTVGDQGSVNVSHGCINLSAKNAEAYFKSALLGDPVEITGTSVQLSDNDGDLFDWTIKWSDWLKLSAL